MPLLAFVVWFLVFDTGLIRGSPGITGDLLHGARGLGYVLAVADFAWTGLLATAAGI